MTPNDRNVEAAIDGIIEAHNVEHGESCDCPIGLAIEEYEALDRCPHGLSPHGCDLCPCEHTADLLAQIETAERWPE